MKRMDNAEHKRVELHMHSKMSDMDGVTFAGELIRQAHECGHKAVAITDMGNVQAFPDMMKTVEKIKKNGGDIKPIYGMETYLLNEVEEVCHATILVKSMGGIKALYKLVSLSYMKYFHKVPRIPMSELKKYRKYFLVGSGCTDGELYQALLMEKSQNEIDSIAELYDYFEIQPYADKEINKKIVELAERHGKLCAATGNVHYKDKEDETIYKIIRSARNKNTDERPPMFFRTTDEMLSEFAYLGEEKAFEVVVTNTNKIADMINGYVRGHIRPLPEGKFFPYLPDSENELRDICDIKAHELYGDTLPEIVEKRLKKELDAIISGDFSVHYMTAQKLVKYSEDNGYHVIARGSVGASLAAFLSGITEVDPLPPHYRCPDCFHSEFITDGSVRSGFELHNKKCPECGTLMSRDGQDIPFETFMGFDGKMTPNIDLNFSGEFQENAIEYVRELFGRDHVFKWGVISAVKNKTAYDLAEKYFNEQGISCTVGEMRDLADGCTGVKKCLIMYPGSLIIIPKMFDVCDFTPAHYPGLYSQGALATHFDFHAFGDMLLKICLLGHDTPTLYKHLEDMTGKKISDMSISSVSDPLVYKLFNSARTLGIPGFGTDFFIKMLEETQPKTFSDLVQIEGLAHGTGTWTGNAQELIKNGTCTLSEVIATRDDVMMYLIRKGIEPSLAFKIMEIVSNGKAEELFNDEIYRVFREHDVPQWYIDSCEKIEYLCPKAHAAAYAAAAVKLAWFKLYYPEEFYAAVLADRVHTIKPKIIIKGKNAVIKRLDMLREKVDGGEISGRESEEIDALRIFLEAISRGCSSDVLKNLKEMGTLKIPDDYSLYGMWNGYERFTWDWSEKQAERMEKFLGMETIDVKGIIEFLNGVHFHFFKQLDAKFILTDLMWHLVDAEFSSDSISDERYRMECEIECRHFIHDLHSIFFKYGTLRNERLYNNRAEEMVAKAWEDAVHIIYGSVSVQLPAESPWTLEQLVNPESLDYLLEILREKCSQNK